MKNNSISIIIPTYNRAHYIGDCIQSLVDQTIPPLEIIVIDDGSTDNTEEIVSRYSEYVTYIRKENGGKAAALNLAIPQTRGKYIWFFDDDDIALPNANELRLNVFNKNPETEFVYGNHIWADENSQGELVPKDYIDVPCLRDKEGFIQLLKYCYFMLSSALIKRTAILNTGAFNEKLLRSQDYEYLIRLARERKFSSCEKNIYMLRRHSGLRGPANLLHTADEKRKVWILFDQIIGKWVRHNIDLSEYIPKECLGIEDERSALLQRASIMASKGLSKKTLDDLVLALEKDTTGPFTPHEVKIISSTFDHPYFWASIKNKREFILKFSELRKYNKGKDLLRILSKSCYWLSKKHNKPEVTKQTLFLYLIALYIFSLNK